MDKKNWTREEIADHLAAFEVLEPDFTSHRQLAEYLNIPRSTLQYWQQRKEHIDADPDVVAFFESPAGVAFLHRLVLAAHFVMTLLGPCGVRLVCRFLELTGLDHFVAASYGPQQRVSASMEQATVEFGQAEDRRLSERMPPKKMAVCEDETFHPETCLVAIEPVSNFILLEQYSADRTAATWTAAMAAAIADRPIEIIQATSDEARGLCHHVKEDLGAHHSPDVFHVQHEIVQGMSAPLAAKKRQAEKGLEEAAQHRARQQEGQHAYHQGPRPPGRPPHFDQRIQTAQEEEEEARQGLETIQTQQEQTREALAGLSQAYHPYDLESGAAQSPEEVSSSLAHHFSTLKQIAHQANLSERSVQKIHKAQRVVTQMVATIAFFFLTLRTKVDALGLAPQVEQAVYEHLIPGIYLSLVARKASKAEQRHLLRKKSEELLAPLRRRDSPFQYIDESERKRLEQVAKECAHLFQRSSSCVEGRNGQLALRHHSLHQLSHRKLTALTTVHNYAVKRPDGTTPAQRFYEAQPRDLFEWILERVDLPGRPAKKRPQTTSVGSLYRATA